MIRDCFGMLFSSTAYVGLGHAYQATGNGVYDIATGAAFLLLLVHGFGVVIELDDRLACNRAVRRLNYAQP